VSQKELAIGINGGGTHTSLVLTDTDLTILARAEVGPSNPNYIGVETAKETIQAGIESLLHDSGLGLDHVVGIGAGLSGVDRPADSTLFLEIFGSLYPKQRIVVENDALAALVAGVGRAFGIVTISGTGMIALGVNGRGERARSGGWGHYMDAGSGYWIARAVMNAVAAAYDGSDIPTALSDAVLNDLALSDATGIIDWAYAPKRRIDEIAALARHAVILAEEGEGDLVARRIIAEAADHLAQETITAGRKLGFAATGEVFPVLLSGSIFKYSALLRDLFALHVQTALPQAVILDREHDAPLGAALMAFSAAGIHTPAEDIPFPAGNTLRATERRHPLTMRIAEQPTLHLLHAMNSEDARIAGILAHQLPQIAALVDAIAPAFEEGGRLIFIGAGTPGRLAVLDASECPPTFSTDGVIGIIAGGEGAITHSIEGAEDSEPDGEAAIAHHAVGDKDTVIGITASGSTPYVIGALREAAKRGAITGCIVNAVNAPLAEIVRHPITLPTGAEALTGSTRLKAATAQKIALNMISTAVMVRAGRTFGNLMTDMQAGNIKLRVRAARIVSEATGLDQAAATALLDRCGGEMKTAIAAHRLSLDPEQARAQLAAAGGKLGHVVRGS